MMCRREPEGQAGITVILLIMADSGEGIPLEVAERIDIRQRVAVEIGDHATAGPLRFGSAGVFRSIAERPIAVIEEQAIGADVAYEDVRKAVVVDISDGDALAVPVFHEVSL